jgi:sulfofructosephosphate aldolase
MTIRVPVLAAESKTAAYEAIARPSGAFAMLALDQRGSLVELLHAAGRPTDEGSMDAFRAATEAAVALEASAILLERGYLSRRHAGGPWAGPCALMVAADRFTQAFGQPLEASELDIPAAAIATSLGARALKLLVLWDEGASNDTRVELANAFVDLAHGAGLLAIVEGIVRSPTPGERPTPGAFLEAASRLSVNADVYKAQVPIHGGDGIIDVEALGRELTAAVPCPWVVLSAGVPAERFAELVAASCRAGASGFLAGRAVWGPSLRTADVPGHLVSHAAPALRELSAVVDAEARPWMEAAAPA